MIFSTVGKVIVTVGLLLVLPLLTAVIYGEWRCALAFGVTIAGALALGSLTVLTLKPKNMIFFSKEGFITVAMCWMVASLVGAVPLVVSGEFTSYIDALFEIVSGLTTTGASVVPNVEVLSKSILFWRSFSHWIGGMGVIVFIMAITARAPDRSMHILRAEMPGPIIDKLVPRSKDTAKILYLIYMVMTVAMVIALLCCGMPFFDSLRNGGNGRFRNKIGLRGELFCRRAVGYNDRNVSVFAELQPLLSRSYREDKNGVEEFGTTRFFGYGCCRHGDYNAERR